VFFADIAENQRK